MQQFENISIKLIINLIKLNFGEIYLFISALGDNIFKIQITPISNQCRDITDGSNIITSHFHIHMNESSPEKQTTIRTNTAYNKITEINEKQ